MVKAILEYYYTNYKFGFTIKFLEENDMGKLLVKLLAYHSIVYDKRGNIERIGLNMYELSNKSTYGTEDYLPDYQRLERKPNYASVYNKLIPELSAIIIISKTPNKYTTHSGKETPLFYLSLTGVMLAILLTNKNFEHTNEIIDNFLNYSKFHKHPHEPDMAVMLLEKFKDLTLEEQKEYLEYFKNEIVSKGIPLASGPGVDRLIFNDYLSDYYSFFLAPVLFDNPPPPKIHAIVKKIWEGNEGIFKRDLLMFLYRHIENFYKIFITRLGFPLKMFQEHFKVVQEAIAGKREEME